MNVVDSLRATLRSIDDDSEFAVVALRDPGASDLAVVVRRREGLRASAARASRALRRRPEVVGVRHVRQRLLVRLSDPVLTSLGAELETGTDQTLASADLLRGHRFVVDFCDPNATKALHLGHLRNVALGNAFACALEAAGARVVRQSQIGDAGHQMGEAMAGWLRYGEGKAPGACGYKADHLVGRCYASYVGAKGASPEGVPLPDLPVAREMSDDDELATWLMRRWQAGDNDVRDLWCAIRDGVVTGHAETLLRLGIRIDRPIFESSYLGRIPRLVRSAVNRGILAYAPNGALIYNTGDAEYPAFPLSRPDEFPNQNLRALVFYHELMSELRGDKMLQVCGTEWRAHHVYLERILRRLRPDLPVQPTRTILYGMVSENDDVVSSSAGNAFLIDHLLDDLVTRDEVRALETPGRSGCEAEDLAVMVALGFCLDRRTTKPISLTPAAVLDDRSAGMTFALAWSKAWSPVIDGGPEPAPDDPAYRFAVLQSQFYRELLCRALESLDLVALVRFLSAISRWYLSVPASKSTGRVMRSVLRVGLRDIGLVRDTGAYTP